MVKYIIMNDNMFDLIGKYIAKIIERAAKYNKTTFIRLRNNTNSPHKCLPAKYNKTTWQEIPTVCLYTKEFG